MLVLGIETTCDETACALVRDGREILSHTIASQVDLHLPFNGVFPELASRRHSDVLIPLIKETLAKANVAIEEIDLVAAARGPGLIGALLIGLNTAKTLSYAWGKPFVGVNHVEAHLYAAMLPLERVDFPAMGLVISGGHTFLVKIHDVGDYEFLGGTRDDAVGEAFDKVATLLGLPYPGGPEVERLAKGGKPSHFALRAGRVKGAPLDFSFSGLKTNVLYTIRDLKRPLSEEERAHLAASFQETALVDVVDKANAAAKKEGLATLFCGGGVSNNRRLRALFAERSSLQVHYPPPSLSLDNGAMIAALGYHCFIRSGGGHSLDMEPQTRIPLHPA